MKKQLVVVVAGPAGSLTYLKQGQEVTAKAATKYRTLWAAHQSAKSYKERHPGLFVGVTDLNDPEGGWL